MSALIPDPSPNNRRGEALPAFSLGDRVRHRVSGRKGTVTYVCRSVRAYAVTVRLDDRSPGGKFQTECYEARELVKIEALF